MFTSDNLRKNLLLIHMFDFKNISHEPHINNQFFQLGEDEKLLLIKIDDFNMKYRFLLTNYEFNTYFSTFPNLTDDVKMYFNDLGV